MLQMKIVLIGGGVGASTFTKALKDLPISLTTIVNVFDDGGSTGLIRRDYGGPAVGDFRNCLVSSIDGQDDLVDALNKRFGPGHLHGANVGNILLKAFFDAHVSKPAAIERLHKLLNLKNKIYPVTYSSAQVAAELAGGRVVIGQSAIAEYLSFSKAPIKKIYLDKKVPLAKEARTALLQAKIIVLAPGHFFTSILPHLAVSGFTEAWKKSPAKKLWFVNLLAHHGQDSYYTLQDYLRWFQKSLGNKPFDGVIKNKQVPKSILKQVEDRFELVKFSPHDELLLRKLGINLAEVDLVSNIVRTQHPNDLIPRAPLRHDSKKIRRYFESIL